MAFAGKDCQQVGNGKARQRCIKVQGVAYGDNCVAIAMKDEGWREDLLASESYGGTRPPEISTMARMREGSRAARARDKNAPSEMPMSAMRRGSTFGRWAM